MSDFFSDFVFWRDVPILFGSFFVLTAAIGVLRFPDLYSRLHASSKLITLGSLGIFLGAALSFSDISALTRLTAALLFQLLTTPLSAYLIAQAAYLRGVKPLLTGPDEWGALGQAEHSPDEDERSEAAG